MMTIGPVAAAVIAPDLMFYFSIRNYASYKKYHKQFEELNEEMDALLHQRAKIIRELALSHKYNRGH